MSIAQSLLPEFDHEFATLRLNDVPVPSTYGPSADEGQM